MVINPQKRDSVVRKNLKLFNMTATPQGDNRQFMSWNHFKASNEWLVASRWNFCKNVITQSTIEIKRNRTPNYSYRSRNSHIYVTAYLHRALIIPCVNFSIARCVGEFSPFPMCFLLQMLCRRTESGGDFSLIGWRHRHLRVPRKNWLRQKISEIFFFREFEGKQFCSPRNVFAAALFQELSVNEMKIFYPSYARKLIFFTN